MAEITTINTPDQIARQWRDDLEEIQRLEHVIADRDDRIDELGRINSQVLFEAQRFKALYEATTSERDYLLRAVEVLRAKLGAIAGVAADVAGTIANLSSMAVDAAAARPEPLTPPQPAAPPIKRPVPADLPKPAPVLADDEDDDPLPIFLTGGTERRLDGSSPRQRAFCRTPMPEVRP